MSGALIRAGEDVGDYIVGGFRDRRLALVGGLLFKRICEGLTVCIKSLASNRASEVAFGRFLGNTRVTTTAIGEELARKTNDICSGKEHVLCVQDTVQLTYPTQPVKKEAFGPTGDSNTKGLFLHPGIIVDAENKDVLGMSSATCWCRSDDKIDPSKKRTIEEKESIRWIDTAMRAKSRITEPKMLTVIGDRESDIFEVFDRVPDARTHLIVRASHDRHLKSDERISEDLNGVESAGIHPIDLQRITGRRDARIAELRIKYSTIEFEQKSSNSTVKVNCVSAVETSSTVPEGEKPISWVLLTTHAVESFEDAVQILTWYTWRWVIEQVFRTMKNKGLKIEDSQIENTKKLSVLSVLCLSAAIKVMSLVEARDGKTDRKATDCFSDDELILLCLICKKMEGKTEKQKNPHPPQTLSWASWVIARLGGWKGYASESPPGPITMLRGLTKFEAQFQGWLLAHQDVCIG